MFKVSNFLQQAKGLPAENSFQLVTLRWADTATLLREMSKCAAAIGVVASASSLVFNFDPTIPLTCTVISGASWLLSSTCAKKLEPQAEEMIKHFEKLQARRAPVHPNKLLNQA